MKLLHGSNMAVKKPDLKLCQSKNDFGRGFYLTPSWNRAWEMGKRRMSIKQEGEITVNPFNFSLKKAKADGLKVALYPDFCVEWARFANSPMIIWMTIIWKYSSSGYPSLGAVMYSIASVLKKQ